MIDTEEIQEIEEIIKIEDMVEITETDKITDTEEDHTQVLPAETTEESMTEMTTDAETEDLLNTEIDIAQGDMIDITYR